jgi:hypothetical protein
MVCVILKFRENLPNIIFSSFICLNWKFRFVVHEQLPPTTATGESFTKMNAKYSGVKNETKAGGRANNSEQ